MNLAEELLLYLWDGGSSEVTDADAADAKLTGNAIKRGDCQSDRSGSTVGCPFGMEEGGPWCFFCSPCCRLSRGCCAAMPAPAVLYGAHNGSTWATLSRPSTLLPLAQVSEGGGGDPLTRILPSIQSAHPSVLYIGRHST